LFFPARSSFESGSAPANRRDRYAVSLSDYLGRRSRLADESGDKDLAAAVRNLPVFYLLTSCRAAADGHQGVRELVALGVEVLFAYPDPGGGGGSGGDDENAAAGSAAAYPHSSAGAELSLEQFVLRSTAKYAAHELMDVTAADVEEVRLEVERVRQAEAEKRKDLERKLQKAEEEKARKAAEAKAEATREAEEKAEREEEERVENEHLQQEKAARKEDEAREAEEEKKQPEEAKQTDEQKHAAAKQRHKAEAAAAETRKELALKKAAATKKANELARTQKVEREKEQRLKREKEQQEEEERQRNAVDCAVGPWGVWSQCSKSCGGGTKVRGRNVTTPVTAPGQACPALSQKRPCGTKTCPPDSYQHGVLEFGSAGADAAVAADPRRLHALAFVDKTSDGWPRTKQALEDAAQSLLAAPDRAEADGVLFLVVSAGAGATDAAASTGGADAMLGFFGLSDVVASRGRNQAQRPPLLLLTDMRDDSIRNFVLPWKPPADSLSAEGVLAFARSVAAGDAAADAARHFKSQPDPGPVAADSAGLVRQLVGQTLRSALPPLSSRASDGAPRVHAATLLLLHHDGQLDTGVADDDAAGPGSSGATRARFHALAQQLHQRGVRIPTLPPRAAGKQADGKPSRTLQVAEVDTATNEVPAALAQGGVMSDLAAAAAAAAAAADGAVSVHLVYAFEASPTAGNAEEGGRRSHRRVQLHPVPPPERASAGADTAEAASLAALDADAVVRLLMQRAPEVLAGVSAAGAGSGKAGASDALSQLPAWAGRVLGQRVAAVDIRPWSAAAAGRKTAPAVVELVAGGAKAAADGSGGGLRLVLDGSNAITRKLALLVAGQGSKGVAGAAAAAGEGSSETGVLAREITEQLLDHALLTAGLLDRSGKRRLMRRMGGLLERFLLVT
jgi:hypothetical protein